MTVRELINLLLDTPMDARVDIVNWTERGSGMERVDRFATHIEASPDKEWVEIRSGDVL